MVVSCVASFAGMLNHIEGDRARGARILRMSYGGLQIPISATEPVANFSPSITHTRNGLRRNRAVEDTCKYFESCTWVQRVLTVVLLHNLVRPWVAILSLEPSRYNFLLHTRSCGLRLRKGALEGLAGNNMEVFRRMSFSLIMTAYPTSREARRTSVSNKLAQERDLPHLVSRSHHPASLFVFDRSLSPSP